jgi:hypothetical protein
MLRTGLGNNRRGLPNSDFGRTFCVLRTKTYSFWRLRLYNPAQSYCSILWGFLKKRYLKIFAIRPRGETAYVKSRLNVRRLFVGEL